MLSGDSWEDPARLFHVGDSRAADLLAACRRENDETATLAFKTLQLLGKSECEPCADLLFSKLNFLGGCGAKFTESDFSRVEQWLAKKRTRTGYYCGKPDPDEAEPLTRVDDAAIYGLILDGSPRSEALLTGLRSLERACTQAPDDWIHGQIVEHAQEYGAAAKAIGHSLTVESESIARSIRASAFYVPKKYRDRSKVEVLAHNASSDRLLLEVSFICGNLCGEGYYVVLQKDAHGWRFDVITMAWIS